MAQFEIWLEFPAGWRKFWHAYTLKHRHKRDRDKHRGTVHRAAFGVPDPKTEKKPAAANLGRLGGLKGSKARAARIHQTLRVKPAMEAGIANHVWTLAERWQKLLHYCPINAMCPDAVWLDFTLKMVLGICL